MPYVATDINRVNGTNSTLKLNEFERRDVKTYLSKSNIKLEFQNYWACKLVQINEK